jgi:hypothetical protein
MGERALGRAPAGSGIVLGSGSDPSVIFEAGIRIPAVFGAAGIKLVVSRRIRAELRSAGLKCCVVTPLITTNLTKTPSWFRKVESCHAPHVVNFFHLELNTFAQDQERYNIYTTATILSRKFKISV